MTTTYIFGAGASAGSDFKLPCMRGFFNNDLRSGHYMALQTFIDRYFSDVPLDELNLEEVITALDLASDSFGKFGQIIDRYIYGARLDFESYVLNRLEYKPLESRYYCKKHLEILKRINKGDSLVTLNYDLVLENSIQEAQKGFNSEDRILARMNTILGSTTQYIEGSAPHLYHKLEGLGFLLKLHGSIDWLFCPKDGCINNKSFYRNNPEVAPVGKSQLCLACGETLEMVIIPPTMGKSFLKFPKMGFIWSLAYKEILLSNRIVFIGTSLAQSDYYLTWLLRNAFHGAYRKPKDVYVVNIDKNFLEKIKYLLGSSLPDENYFSSLEEFSQRFIY